MLVRVEAMCATSPPTFFDRAASAGRRYARQFFSLLPVVLLLVSIPPPAKAQEKSSASVQEFVRLLDDPDVRTWLQQATTERAAPATPVETRATEGMSSRLDKVRDHLRTIGTALPRFPHKA